MEAVADTSSLIHPAKVPAFWDMMIDTFDRVLIPLAVQNEILKGKESGHLDVPIIEKAINDGWIKVRSIKSKAKLPENLGEGEKEAIILMLKEKADWLLMDDQVASVTARSLGLVVRPAVYLLIYWPMKEMMEVSKAQNLLDDLVRTGYRLSTRDYVSIKTLIKNQSR